MSWFSYVKPDKNTRTQPGVRTNQAVPVFIQFIEGHVIDVITHAYSAAYTEARDINAVIAEPHYNKDVDFSSLVTEKYYPLLRGQADIPTHGDQVLLCKFGGVPYYLGPINTANSPNFNPDHLKSTDPILSGKKSKSTVSERKKYGLSNSFKLLPMSRL